MNIDFAEVKIYLIILVIFLVIDIPMITMINKDMYNNHFNKINNGDMVVGNKTYIGASITYLLLALGLYIFVIRDNTEKPLKYKMIKGAVLGLIIYGVYNFTNLATINIYEIKPALIDTMWGSVASALIVYIYNHYFESVNKFI